MTASSRASRAPSWILSPALDGVFVLGAPLLALGAAVAAFAWWGAGAASGIIVFHVIATVAHHLPTFLRIYGDVELFRRFRWQFILGPLLPFGIALSALAYINIKGYPLETFFYLMIVLTLWDPWHFFMQHYGFMRIYDRGSTAPSRPAAAFDFWLCAIWFASMLLLSSDWLTQILVGLYEHSRLPVLLVVSLRSLEVLQTAALAATGLVSLAYLGHVAWCWHRGIEVRWPKLVLSAITFGVMYLAYTPNALMQALAPGWSFQVGFAVIGVVHVSQYLAIVWRYNRALAQRPGRMRPGWFQRWHARAGAWAAVAYVALCLGYGALLTTVHSHRWLMAVMLALGFTSTLMHYYFDGFIWKVRHAQNQELLGATEARASSWWQGAAVLPAGATLRRHLLYFGLPLGLLTTAAWWVWSPPPLSHLDHMRLAQAANQTGDQPATVREIRAALAAMDAELPIARRLVELKPTASREASLAFLLYWKTHYTAIVLPELGLERTLPDPLAAAQQIDLALTHLRRARDLPGEVAFAGREGLTRSDLAAAERAWRDVQLRLTASKSVARHGGGQNGAAQ